MDKAFFHLISLPLIFKQPHITFATSLDEGISQMIGNLGSSCCTKINFD